MQIIHFRIFIKRFCLLPNFKTLVNREYPIDFDSRLDRQTDNVVILSVFLYFFKDTEPFKRDRNYKSPNLLSHPRAGASNAPIVEISENETNDECIAAQTRALSLNVHCYRPASLYFLYILLPHCCFKWMMAVLPGPAFVYNLPVSRSALNKFWQVSLI